MLLVLTEDEIHYNYAHDLISEIKILKRQYLRKDPVIFYKFYRLCIDFKPDVIHTWGSMLAFYALPVSLFKRIPHINGHIADAPGYLKKSGFHYFVTKIGFHYSDIVLSNSLAGLKSYNVSGDKCHVIYNGLDLRRFDNLHNKDQVRLMYGINTRFLIIMVASYTTLKKYDQFLEVAESFISERDDVTFLAVGDTNADRSEFERIQTRYGKLANTKLLNKIDQVEPLINASDIGILFTHGEGISNSILEYMACAKPVLASDAGGTIEIIDDGKTGFLITHHSTNQIKEIINGLLEDEDWRNQIGFEARTTVEKRFAIDLMGKNFEELYQSVFKKPDCDQQHN